MKRIGIYHYQYYRGACKLCYRHFIQEMVESYEKCHEVAKEIYGEDNLIKLCNIKQIVQYAVMKCQPVWLDEGYNGKLIAYYYKPETEKAWNYWKSNNKD